MDKYAVTPLIEEAQIQQRVRALGKQITDDYENSSLVVVCVLKGSFMFCSDLIRALNVPVELDFIQISSYGDSTESSGVVKINMDITTNLRGKNCLIVEDIVDTGLSLSVLRNHLQRQSPRSIATCALLSKPSRREIEVPVEYVGIEIEDHFVVGYGLDYDQRYRTLPYLGVMSADH